MFPLDDNFVFGDIFFLWLIFFFGRGFGLKFWKMGVLTASDSRRPAIRACDAAAKRPPGRRESEAVNTPIFQNLRPNPRPKKNTQPTKKKYSPTNEVTHPTETPICLWYKRFMPPTLPPNEKIPKVPESLTGAFFLPKKTSLLCYFQLVTFHFIFHSFMQIAFFFYQFGLFVQFEIVKIMISFLKK